MNETNTADRLSVVLDHATKNPDKEWIRLAKEKKKTSPKSEGVQK